MTGSQLAEIRRHFGMTRKQFSALLGYDRTAKGGYAQIERYERDGPPEHVARLATLLKWYHDDFEVLPDW